MLCHSRVLSDALGTNKNIAEPQYNHQSQEIIIDTFLPSNPQIPFTFYQLSPVLLSFKAGLASNFIFGHQRVLGMVDRLAFLKDLSGCVSRMYWRERKWRLEDKLGSS